MLNNRKTITNTDYLAEDEAKRLIKRLKKYLKEYKNNNNPEKALKNLLFTETKLGKYKKIPPLIDYIETWIKKALSEWGKIEGEYWPEYHIFLGNDMTFLYHNLFAIAEKEERYFKRDEIRQEILLILMERLKDFTFYYYDDNSFGYKENNISEGDNSDSENIMRAEEQYEEEQNFKAAYHRFLSYIRETIEKEVLSKIVDMDGYKRKSDSQQKNDTKNKNNSDKYYQHRFVCGKNEGDSENSITQIDDYITHRRNKYKNTSSHGDVDYAVLSENAFNTTEVEVMNRERNQGIKDISAKLPGEQKRALEDYFFKDMTQAEIAHKEDITQQAVSLRLQNAYEFLKKEWSKDNTQAS